MTTLLAWISWPFAVVGVFLASTVAFDVVHWLLHQLARSRSRPLRAIGSLHETHHRFLDAELRIHDELIGQNIRHHVIPEFLTQAAFSAALLLVLPISVVAGAFALQLGVFAWILRDRGLDVNHRGCENLAAFRPLFFCVPEYHALHHVHPDTHYSSWIKVLDWLLATGAKLEGQRVVWRGADDAPREAMAEALREEGARLEDGPVAEADILVLAGDDPSDDELSEAAFFVASSRTSRLPRELWRLGAVRREAPIAGPPDVIYRELHLGAGDGAPACSRALGRIRRGLHAV